MPSKNDKKKKFQSPRKPKSAQLSNQPIIKPVALRGPKYHIEHAHEYPIFGCWVRQDWDKGGLTPVVIARQQSPDRVVFAVFLVDYYCLGVKDAMSNADFPLKRFQDNLDSLCAGISEPCDVDFAHELVYGAIEFASKYGFEPHPDFKLASSVLDPADTHPPRHQLEFGKDGKPMFISGPYDDTQAILAKLDRTAGEGNYHFLAALDPSPDLFDVMEFDADDENDADDANIIDIK